MYNIAIACIFYLQIRANKIVEDKVYANKIGADELGADKIGAKEMYINANFILV